MSCIRVSCVSVGSAPQITTESGLFMSISTGREGDGSVIGADREDGMRIQAEDSTPVTRFSAGLVCPLWPDIWYLLVAVDGDYITADGKPIMLKKYGSTQK